MQDRVGSRHGRNVGPVALDQPPTYVPAPTAPRRRVRGGRDSGPRDRVTAVDVTTRRCSKVLLVDEQERVLLFSGIDRTKPELRSCFPMTLLLSSNDSSPAELPLIGGKEARAQPPTGVVTQSIRQSRSSRASRTLVGPPAVHGMAGRHARCPEEISFRSPRTRPSGPDSAVPIGA